MKVTVSTQPMTDEMRIERDRRNKIAMMIEADEKQLAELGIVVETVASFTTQSSWLYLDDKSRVARWNPFDYEIPTGTHTIKRYSRPKGDEWLFEVRFSEERVTTSAEATQFVSHFGGLRQSEEFIGVLLSSPTFAVSTQPDTIQAEFTPTHGKDFYHTFWMASGNARRSLIIDPGTFNPLPEDILRTSQIIYAQKQTDQALANYLDELKTVAEREGAIEPETRLAGHFYVLTQAYPLTELFARLKKAFTAPQYLQILNVYHKIFWRRFIHNKKLTKDITLVLDELIATDSANKHNYLAFKAYLLAQQGELAAAYAVVKPTLDDTSLMFSVDAIEKLSNCAYELVKKDTPETDQQARELYLLCAKQQPEKALYNYMAAWIVYKKDTPEAYAQALPYAEKAVQLKPTDSNYMITYANLLVENKRFDDAHQTFLKITEIDPDFTYAAYCNLANMYNDLHEYDQAWKWIQKAYELKPDVEVIKKLYNELKAKRS